MDVKWSSTYPWNKKLGKCAVIKCDSRYYHFRSAVWPILHTDRQAPTTFKYYHFPLQAHHDSKRRTGSTALDPKQMTNKDPSATRKKNKKHLGPYGPSCFIFPKPPFYPKKNSKNNTFLLSAKTAVIWRAEYLT